MDKLVDRIVERLLSEGYVMKSKSSKKQSKRADFSKVEKSMKKAKKEIPKGLLPYTIANKAIKGADFSSKKNPADAKKRFIRGLVKHYDHSKSPEENLKVFKAARESFPQFFP